MSSAETWQSRLRTFVEKFIERIHRARREVFWVVLGQGLTFIGGFVGLKLLTGVMGPTGYGQFALGMTIAGIVGTIAFAPIGQAVLRFVSIYRERRTLPVLIDLIAKTHAIAAVGSLVLMVGGSAVAYAVGGSEWALLVVVSLLFGTLRGWSTTLFSILDGFRKRATAAIYQGTDALTRPLLAVGAMVAFSMYQGWIVLAAFSVAMLAVVVPQFCSIRTILAEADPTIVDPHRRSVAWAEFPHRVHELALFSGPLILWSIVGIAALYGDRWVLAHQLGASGVGIYAAIYQIANTPVILIGGVVSQFVIPVLYDRAGAMTHPEQVRRSDRLLNYAVLVFSLLCAMVLAFAWLVSEVLVELLTTPAFATSHNILPILLGSAAIFQIGQLLSLRGFYHNRTAIYILPKILHGAVTLAAVYVLAQSFGLAGAAWGIGIGATTYLVMVFLANQATLRSVIRVAGSSSAQETIEILQ